MSKTSNERFQESGKSYNNAGKGYGKVWEGVKHLPQALRDTIKGTWEGYDGLNKKVGELIEKKNIEKGKDTTGKIRSLLRNNIIRLSILLALSGTFGGIKISEKIKEKKDDEKELIMDETFANTIEEQQRIIKKLFEKEDIIHDIEGSGKKQQQYWYNRYLGNDESWLKERAKLIEGFIRMVESGDLEMVLQKAEEAGVPRQCVFLALAESRREYGANSGKAGGPRQFTRDSAIRFGLNKEGGEDNRQDPVKSTEAAMRHLVANYEYVENTWGKNKRLTESDKRMLAFYMYNGSPKLVKRGYNLSSGNLDEYPVKQTNRENRKYVPRILGIQDALEEIFKKYNYDINQIRLSIGTRTQGDIMYEEYKTKIRTDTDAQIRQLELIKEEYTLEFQNKIITEKYYNGAKSVIDKEISRLQGK